MNDLQILRDLVVLFGCTVPVVYLLHRLKQSPIVAYVITGVLIGPYSLSLVRDVSTVHTLATVGVMILLFSVGLEFSFKTLMETKAAVLMAGPTQAYGTAALVMCIAYLLGVPLRSSLVYGVLIAVSSTAVLVKILVERGEVNSMHGRVGLGISIFNDLFTIPFIVLIPYLGGGEGMLVSLTITLGKAVAIVAGVIVGARYLFPQLLDRIVQSGSKELFLLACAFVFLSIAWLTGEAGVSLALGSFLAGLILSESDYGHQVFAEARPFRDSLNSLFFVSVGMLVQPEFVWQNLGTVVAFTLALMLGKALVATGAVLLIGLPMHVAVLSAVTLSQIGEYSFILLQAGSASGLVSDRAYQVILAASLISMVLTPLAFDGTRRAVARRVLGQRRVSPSDSAVAEALTPTPFHDHVIICGFGVAGHNIAQVTRANDIPYVIVDLNAQRVREAAIQGEPILFGDCTNVHILETVGVRRARGIVLVISDPFSTRLAVPTIRALNKDVTILTRTKYISDIDELWDLGSREVIAEEFEASLELITRILRLYNTPRAMVATQIKSIRDQRFEIFRGRKPTVPRLRLSSAVDVYTETLELPQDCPWNGATVAQTNLRAVTGAWVLGIIRRNQTISNPGATEQLLCGDRIILSGTKEQLKRAVDMLTLGGRLREEPSSR